MKLTKLKQATARSCCTALNLKFLSVEIPSNVPEFGWQRGATLVGAALGLSVLQTQLGRADEVIAHSGCAAAHMSAFGIKRKLRPC